MYQAFVEQSACPTGGLASRRLFQGEDDRRLAVSDSPPSWLADPGCARTGRRPEPGERRWENSETFIELN